MTAYIPEDMADTAQVTAPKESNGSPLDARAVAPVRDVSDRDRIVCEHLHLVYSVARRFSGLGESLDDLIQEGAIGLLNAVDMFDPDRGVKFSTYATHLISGQIQHYLRDRGRLIRQPAWVQELSTKVARATEQLTQDLGREPQESEVAAHLSLTEESLHNVLAARELNHVISLSGPSDNGDPDQPALDGERLSIERSSDMSLPLEDRLVIDEAIATLKPLEQKVVHGFFFGDLSQTEVARMLGISVNYTSYLLRRATNKIKAFVDTQREQENAVLAAAPPTLAAEPVIVYDPETGTHSAAYMRQRVTEEIARCQRYPTNFALMLVDVHGMPEDLDAQQPLVQAVSAVFRTTTRAVDLVTYQGGGRFALLLPHTGREARVLGDRLCSRVAQRAGQPASQGAPASTLNIGYGVYPIDGTDVDMLFLRVERALASAVKSGPNTACSVAASSRPVTA
jgi:RNA polymerase sigma-B factor